MALRIKPGGFCLCDLATYLVADSSLCYSMMIVCIDCLRQRSLVQNVCLVQLINLARARDRLAQFDEQAKRAGFEYRRFEAIEGADPEMLALSLRTRMSWKPEHPLTPNVVALGLSHRGCWQAFLESDYKTSIIFEDDVQLAPEFSQVLQEGWIPQGADIIRLEAFSTTTTKLSKKKYGAIGERAIFRLRGDHVGAAAYLITRKGAQMLLDAIPEITAPIDIMMFCTEASFFHRTPIYQLVPAPCIQAGVLGLKADWAQSSVQIGKGDPLPNARQIGGVETLRLKGRVAFFRTLSHLKNMFSGHWERVRIPFG